MVVLFLVLILGVSTGAAIGEEADVKQQIADAVSALPPPLRAGATVVLEPEPGKRTVLRKGTNSMMCQADTPAPEFAVNCYHKEDDAINSRFMELAAAKKSEAEIRDMVSAEVKAGKFKVEAGRVTYSLTGPFQEAALPLMSVYAPNATAESTGLSTEMDHFRPWLMWAGTPVAHIMLPGK